MVSDGQFEVPLLAGDRGAVFAQQALHQPQVVQRDGLAALEANRPRQVERLLEAAPRRNQLAVAQVHQRAGVERDADLARVAALLRDAHQVVGQLARARPVARARGGNLLGAQEGDGPHALFEALRAALGPAPARTPPAPPSRIRPASRPETTPRCERPESTATSARASVATGRAEPAPPRRQPACLAPRPTDRPPRHGPARARQALHRATAGPTGQVRHRPRPAAPRAKAR